MENYIRSNKEKFKEIEDYVESQIKDPNEKNMNFKIIYDETPSLPDYPYGHIVFLDTETGEKLPMDLLKGTPQRIWDKDYPKNEKINNIKNWSRIQKEAFPYLIQQKLEILYDKMSPQEKELWNWKAEIENDSKSNKVKWFFTNSLTGEKTYDVLSLFIKLPAWAVINLVFQIKAIQLEIQGKEITAPTKAETDRLAQEAERLAREKAETERLAREKDETDRIAREKDEADRIAREKADRKARVREEAERLTKLGRDKTEADKIAKEKAEADRIAQAEAQAEADRVAQAEADRVAQVQAEAQAQAEAEAQAEADRVASIQLQAQAQPDMAFYMDMFFNASSDIKAILDKKKEEEAKKKEEEDRPIGLDKYNNYKDVIKGSLDDIGLKISFCNNKQISLKYHSLPGYKNINFEWYVKKKGDMMRKYNGMNENTRTIDFDNLVNKITEIDDKLNEIDRNNFEITRNIRISNSFSPEQIEYYGMNYKMWKAKKDQNILDYKKKMEDDEEAAKNQKIQDKIDAENKIRQDKIDADNKIRQEAEKKIRDEEKKQEQQRLEKEKAEREVQEQREQYNRTVDSLYEKVKVLGFQKPEISAALSFSNKNPDLAVNKLFKSRWDKIHKNELKEQLKIISNELGNYLDNNSLEAYIEQNSKLMEEEYLNSMNSYLRKDNMITEFTENNIYAFKLQQKYNEIEQQIQLDIQQARYNAKELQNSINIQKQEEERQRKLQEEQQQEEDYKRLTIERAKKSKEDERKRKEEKDRIDLEIYNNNLKKQKELALNNQREETRKILEKSKAEQEAFRLNNKKSEEDERLSSIQMEKERKELEEIRKPILAEYEKAKEGRAPTFLERNLWKTWNPHDSTDHSYQSYLKLRDDLNSIGEHDKANWVFKTKVATSQSYKNDYFEKTLEEMKENVHTWADVEKIANFIGTHKGETEKERFLLEAQDEENGPFMYQAQEHFSKKRSEAVQEQYRKNQLRIAREEAMENEKRQKENETNTNSNSYSKTNSYSNRSSNTPTKRLSGYHDGIPYYRDGDGNCTWESSGGARKINTYKKRKQNKIRKTNKRRKTPKTNKKKTIKRRKIIKRRNTYKK